MRRLLLIVLVASSLGAQPVEQLPATPVREIDLQLFDAIERNDLAALRSLIARGANVNSTARGTPLNAAIDRNSLPAIRLLLEAGARPELGYPAAPYVAASGGHWEAFDLVLPANRALYDNRELTAALRFATADARRFEALLRAGASWDPPEVLSDAAAAGCVACVELLLGLGATPSPQSDPWAENAYSAALGSGNKRIIRLLAERMGVDRREEPALIVAAREALKSSVPELRSGAVRSVKTFAVKWRDRDHAVVPFHVPIDCGGDGSVLLARTDDGWTPDVRGPYRGCCILVTKRRPF